MLIQTFCILYIHVSVLFALFNSIFVHHDCEHFHFLVKLSSIKAVLQKILFMLILLRLSIVVQIDKRWKSKIIHFFFPRFYNRKRKLPILTEINTFIPLSTKKELFFAIVLWPDLNSSKKNSSKERYFHYSSQI